MKLGTSSAPVPHAMGIQKIMKGYFLKGADAVQNQAFGYHVDLSFFYIDHTTNAPWFGFDGPSPTVRC
jgi:hypothetical protein